jgi:hypothetical protein
MNNWPMLAYAGFSYVTADFSLAEYRIQLFVIPAVCHPGSLNRRATFDLQTNHHEQRLI